MSGLYLLCRSLTLCKEPFFLWLLLRLISVIFACTTMFIVVPVVCPVCAVQFAH